MCLGIILMEKDSMLEKKIGFIKTTLDFALKREDLRAEILHYLELVLVRENA